MTTYAKSHCKVLLLSTVLCFFAVEARAKDYVLVKDKMTEFVAKGVKADTTAEDTMRYLAGGLLGTFVGFGIGHALQGRWDDDYGWVFAATQLGGIALLSLEVQWRCWPLPQAVTILTYLSLATLLIHILRKTVRLVK